MFWIILGLLFVFILFIAGQEDLPYEKEDEILLYNDEKEEELLEDEIL
ncbi:unnamed protein product, partial [marine sediment metagenome]